MNNVPLELDRIAVVVKPGDAVTYSPYGYIIAPDGTTYCLTYRYYHGIICALLHSEIAEPNGWPVPTEPHDELNVFEYQDFELTYGCMLSVVRISLGSTGVTYFSKGNQTATEPQIQAVLSCAKALGYRGRDKIETDSGVQTVAQVVERLRTAQDYEVNPDNARNRRVPLEDLE